MLKIAKMKYITNIGCKMAVAFGIKPECIFWTFLNSWTKKYPHLATGKPGLIRGQHFDVFDPTDRQRILKQTKIRNIPNGIFHIIAIQLQGMYLKKSIENIVMHELVHVAVPIYRMQNGKWSNIHSKNFDEKLREFKVIWQKAEHA